MIALLSPSHNPYFNIALEYYLLHSFTKEALLIYRNETSVVVGKHQNAFAEANQQFLHANQIPLVRRISGGGTVYHDLGNINVTLIQKGKLNFNNLLLPLKQVLEKFGLKTEITSKNDILIDGKKITGTAAHVYKDKTLHHATLLFDASQEMLHKCLNGNKACFIDKAVRSRPSPTVNIKDCLSKDFSIEQFEKNVFNELKVILEIGNEMDLNSLDYENINAWVHTRFFTWDWNYAYSPEFIFKNNVCQDGIELQTTIFVKNGKIGNAEILFNNEIINIDALQNTLFIRENLIQSTAFWTKKNCPMLSLSSLELLFEF